MLGGVLKYLSPGHIFHTPVNSLLQITPFGIFKNRRVTGGEARVTATPFGLLTEPWLVVYCDRVDGSCLTHRSQSFCPHLKRTAIASSTPGGTMWENRCNGYRMDRWYPQLEFHCPSHFSSTQYCTLSQVLFLGHSVRHHFWLSTSTLIHQAKRAIITARTNAANRIISVSSSHLTG